MNPNPRAILTGALLAAGTAGIQAVLTALGCGPAGIITSIAALLTTAITVLGPKLIDLRAQQQFGKEIRWLVMHKVAGDDLKEIVMQLKDFHEKVLQAHVAAIKAARTETKKPSMRRSRRSSAATS
jgi:citrate lyase gamma subunit